MKKFLTRTLCVINAVFLLWMFASWVDIVWDNTSENPVHSEYNMFVMAFPGDEE